MKIVRIEWITHISAVAEHNSCFSKWKQTIRFWTRRKRNNQPVFCTYSYFVDLFGLWHLKNLIKSRAHNHSLTDWQLGCVRTCRPAVQRTHIIFFRSWWMWSGGGFRCLRLIIIIEQMQLMKSSFIGMECAIMHVGMMKRKHIENLFNFLAQWGGERHFVWRRPQWTNDKCVNPAI